MTPITDCEHKDNEDGCCGHPSAATSECHIGVCPRLAPFIEDTLDALEELVGLVEAVREGEYEIDYFTTQPGRKAIIKARGQPKKES